jgi:endoglucanase
MPSAISAYENNLRIVDMYGYLKVRGNQIVNEDGKPVALRGMSFFWSQWMGKYYNYNCVKWLRDDWKCTIVRAALGVSPDGYLANRDIEKEKVKTVIDACLDLGIYVIVDWHSHNAHKETSEAIEFFKEIATLYGDKPNIIYEIYNEPEKVSWKEIIKPYADSVICAIRKIDPDNIIVVGTPVFSADVDVAANDPIEYENIAYALHFYAATHKEWLRTKAINAMDKGIALFVTEFGTCASNGDGAIDYEEMNLWFDFMDRYKISWCNWSIADKKESASALNENAKIKGRWSDAELTESGKLVRAAIISRFKTDIDTFKN